MSGTPLPLNNEEEDQGNLSRYLIPVVASIAVIVIVIIIAAIFFRGNSVNKNDSMQATIAKLQSDVESLRRRSEADVLKVELQQKELEILREGVNPNTNIDVVLGKSNSGFITSTNLLVKKMHVYSLGGPYKDPEIGDVWIANEDMNRLFVAKKDSSFIPGVVYHDVKNIPDGLTPIIHPTKEIDGMHYIVFVIKKRD